MRNDVIFVGIFGIANGDKHQSAPSEVALTDAAFTVPDENSMPALTHLQECDGRRDDPVTKLRTPISEDEDRKDSVGSDWLGASPAKMTNPPWSHSISQSALMVTSATTNGLRKDVKTMGAVDVSPLGGFLHKSVLGPAESVK